ncbi:ATP-binding protein [Kitasatospora sp. NPDC059571]|uniref:ATP-binding protein n=1 Tax=Kitasatospora sp. NPDC059571 TaxID=3346871 RepID=UPI0036AB495B
MFTPSAEHSQSQRVAGAAWLSGARQEPVRCSPRLPGTKAGRCHTFTLLPRDTSIRAARNTVGETLCGWGAGDTEDVVDTVKLIVSELVTNAVRHAGQVTALISVTMLLDSQGGFQLGVRDGDQERPHASPVPSDATSGRGIHIVQTLLGEAGGHCSTECHRDGGKTVWITIPCAFR